MKSEGIGKDQSRAASRPFGRAPLILRGIGVSYFSRAALPVR